MSTIIHPTAIVEEGVQLGENVKIGPYCVVGPDVVLGDNVELRSHVCVGGRTTIGENTKVFPFASLGQETPDLKYHGEPSELHIGKNCSIREYVTMNPGTEVGGMKTIVGDYCLFMPSSHVAHDCIVGDHVIMANSAALGGHVQVGDYVVIGGLAAVHQFVRIGSYAVIGGMCGIGSDIIPFGRARGEKGFLAGLNLVGLERQGFDKAQIKILQRAFNELFGEEGTFEQRLLDVEENYSNIQEIMDIVSFARDKGKFGLCQPPRKEAA